MLYLTNIYALNLPCSLETPGDWHRSALDWSKAESRLEESENSALKDYGIEKLLLPVHLRQYFSVSEIFVANHIRACIDLLEKSRFAQAQGMRKDFICVNEYDNEIFEKVLLLKAAENWEAVYQFMLKEYRGKWVNYYREKNNE